MSGPHADHLIWLVCAAFYLSDQVRWCRPRELLVASRGKAWHPVLPNYRFLVRNREFTLLNPFNPWSDSLQLRWLSASDVSDAALCRQARLVRVAHGRFGSIRVAGTVVSVSLFVVGPAATEIAGIGLALMVVLPALVAMWVLVLVTLVANRRSLPIRKGALAWLLAECALSPGYFANLWRRFMIAGFSTNADAVVFCGQTPGPGMDRALTSLSAYVRDLRERELLSCDDLKCFSSYEAAFSITNREGTATNPGL